MKWIIIIIILIIGGLIMALNFSGIFGNSIMKPQMDDGQIWQSEGDRYTPRQTPGINQAKTKEISRSNSDTISSNSYVRIDSMVLTHKSQTGRSLILFQAQTNPEVNVQLFIALFKNGVKVDSTDIDVNRLIDDGYAASSEGIHIPVSIHHVDLTEVENTWEIKAYVTEHINSGTEADIFTRKFTIVDLI